LNKGFKKDFDLYVFEKNSDYLCYVEAIYSLYHEKELIECEFTTQKLGIDFIPEIKDKVKFTDY